MAKAKSNSKKITLEESLVPVEEQPYEVPENWCWVKHNSILDISGGSQPAKSHFITEPREGYTQLYQTRDYGEHPIPVYIPNKYATKTTCEGDILLARYGGSLGKVFRAHDGAHNVALTKVIKIYPELIDDEFLYKYYLSQFYQNFCIKASNGRSAQAGFNRDDMNSLPFPLPPLAEQKRIVEQIENLFAKLDEAREKAQEILDTFNDRKAAILYKAFQGNLTKQWRKEHSDISAIEYLRKIEKSGEDFSKKEFKFWESNELPKTWAESKIGNLLYFAGRIGWKGLKADEYTEEGPLLLSVYNLNDGDEVSYNRVYHITTERYEESPEIMVEIGDVLLTKDGAGIGKLGYVKELPQEATINSSLLLIRPGNTAISKYIFYLLSGPELQSIVKERITGSATPHLFQRDIKEFTIPIPPLEEQEEIVRILDDVLEKEKIAYESAENVISQIELMKKSILAKAFRGELGTNNPEEESSSELLKSIIEGEK